jgi:tetratricopeptide (TPR) repeat protein
MNKRILRAFATGFIVLVLVSCDAEKKPAPNCNHAFAEVDLNIMAMEKHGYFKKARKKAKWYKQCYAKRVDYWLMRARLVPSAQHPKNPTKDDLAQAVKYLNHALALEPKNGYVKIIKSNLLLAQKKYKKSEYLYETGLKKAVADDENDPNLLYEQLFAIDQMPGYIYNMKQQHRMAHAQTEVQPFLAWVCNNRPKLRKHYAPMLIRLSREFAKVSGQKQPPESAGKVSKNRELNEACASFQPAGETG